MAYGLVFTRYGTITHSDDKLASYRAGLNFSSSVRMATNYGGGEDYSSEGYITDDTAASAMGW